VIFKGHDRFYARNSAGKYPLDVNELRAAFTYSSTLVERIRAFRTDRVIALTNNEAPVPFTPDPKLVLHCIPLESFAGQPVFDVLQIESHEVFRPMGTGFNGYRVRINLEGLIVFSLPQPSISYTQIHRNGIIEAAHGGLLTAQPPANEFIPSVAYERTPYDYLAECFRLLRTLGVNVPIAVSLTLLRTRGLRMHVDHMDPGEPIQAQNLILPETLVQDFTTPAGKILKPMFDLVWNACGYAGSRNFDAEGNWVRNRR
jgi:hypothetical protein